MEQDIILKSNIINCHWLIEKPHVFDLQQLLGVSYVRTIDKFGHPILFGIVGRRCGVGRPVLMGCGNSRHG